MASVPVSISSILFFSGPELRDSDCTDFMG